MGSRIRAHDWASSQLGAPDTWPQALKTTLRLMLDNGHPMFVWWGPDLIQFYNDPYRQILGPDRHPTALGQPGRDCWNEVWDIIGPQIEQVMAAGGSTWHENQLVPFTRDGHREDLYWTYSYSPIDDSEAPNGVGGLLVIAADTTATVLAEQRNKDDSRRLQQMFKQAPGFICMLRGPDHVYEYVNDAYIELLGARDFVGKPVRDVVPETEGQVFLEMLDRINATGEAVTGTRVPLMLAIGPGGALTERLVDFVYQPVKDAAGRVEGIFVEGFDSTDQATTEAAVREREAQLRTLNDTLEQRIADSLAERKILADIVEDTDASVQVIDMDFNILATNAAYRTEFARIYGVVLAIGDNLVDRLAGYPDEQTKVRQYWARALAGETYNFVDEFGAAGRAKSYFQVKFNVLRDKRGEQIGAFQFAYDVTERILNEAELDRAKEALREAESDRRFRVLAEGMPQLVWRSGDGGDWTWASPQWRSFTGQTQAESLGTGWLDAVHPDDRPAARAAWANAARSDRLEFEIRVRRASDGNYLWHQTRAVPLHGSDGTPVEWLGTMTDVQKLKELQDQQDVLVAELQHRTRNLIAVVQSIADKTLQGSSALDDFQTRFRMRMAALARVQGLLSRSDASHNVTFDALLRGELSAHGALDDPSVTLDGPADVRLSSGAVQTLALAIHELATNAVKYGALSQPEAHLDVRWHVEPAHELQQHRLHILWQESDVAMPPPELRVSSRQGYGRELIERALPYQLKAETNYALGSGGVGCSIAIPLPAHNPGEVA